jgi:hypothetical protein
MANRKCVYLISNRSFRHIFSERDPFQSARPVHVQSNTAKGDKYGN